MFNLFTYISDKMVKEELHRQKLQLCKWYIVHYNILYSNTDFPVQFLRNLIKSYVNNVFFKCTFAPSLKLSVKFYILDWPVYNKSLKVIVRIVYFFLSDDIHMNFLYRKHKQIKKIKTLKIADEKNYGLNLSNTFEIYTVEIQSYG